MLCFTPEVKLSADDSVQVIEWTHAERRRLRASDVQFAGEIATVREYFRDHGSLRDEGR